MAKIVNGLAHEMATGTFVNTAVDTFRGIKMRRKDDPVFGYKFSLAEIAKIAECSVSTVRPVVKKMVENGTLIAEQRCGRNKQKYRLNK